MHGRKASSGSVLGGGICLASAPHYDDFWISHLGTGIIADAFRWAHQADPRALLFYNDYNDEGINSKSDATYAFVRQLLAQGVPINGVGLQLHLDVQYPFPDQMVGWPAGISPAGSHGSVREPLGSYGSSHPVVRSEIVGFRSEQESTPGHLVGGDPHEDLFAGADPRLEA